MLHAGQLHHSACGTPCTVLHAATAFTARLFRAVNVRPPENEELREEIEIDLIEFKLSLQPLELDIVVLGIFLSFSLFTTS